MTFHEALAISAGSAAAFTAFWFGTAFLIRWLVRRNARKS